MKSGFTYKGKLYEFKRVAYNYHLVRQQIPGVVGTVAVNFFKDSFRRQGWRDRSLERWQSRSKQAKRNKGHAILISSGRLRNSIRITEQNFNRTVIGTNTPYAQAHNEGFKGIVSVKAHQRGKFTSGKEKYTTKAGKERNRTRKEQTGSGTVRAHTRNMNLPKRQFMGNSEILELKLTKSIELAIIKIFEL